MTTFALGVNDAFGIDLAPKSYRQDEKAMFFF